MKNLKFSFLKEAIEKAWDQDTAYNGVWTEKNKSYGQCAVTALLVQNYFQGKIYKADVKGEQYSHFWNVLPDGKVKDLTKSQFRGKTIELINIRSKTVDELMMDKDLKKRYEILKKRVENFF